MREKTARVEQNVFELLSNAYSFQLLQGHTVPPVTSAKSQVGVDYRGQNTVKFVQNEKYSAKSGDFLRFFAYLCHVIDDFC